MEYNTEDLLVLVQDEISDVAYDIFSLMIDGASREQILKEVNVCECCYEKIIDDVREKMNEKITMAANTGNS